MPTYEYKCDSCGHTFEKFQSIKDEPLTACEACGAEVRRLFGTAGIIFKGSGFYVNDYKNGSAETGKSTPSEKSAPAESPCATCSENC
jgi:putative FmdB family regulatory protein